MNGPPDEAVGKGIWLTCTPESGQTAQQTAQQVKLLLDVWFVQRRAYAGYTAWRGMRRVPLDGADLANDAIR